MRFILNIKKLQNFILGLLFILTFSLNAKAWECLPVSVFETTAITETSVEFTWEQAGEFDYKWTVAWGTQGFSGQPYPYPGYIGETIIELPQLTHQITGLEPGTWYDVRFMSWCDNGEGGTGGSSDAIFSFKTKDLPGPGDCPEPTGIALSGLTETTANITWDESPLLYEGGGNIVGSWLLYLVYEGEEDPFAETIDYRFTNDNFTFYENLAPGTSYDLYIQSSCVLNIGASDYEKITFTTLGEAPSDCPPVTNITSVESMDGTELEISWEPGGQEQTWDFMYGSVGFDPEMGGSIYPYIEEPGITIGTYSEGVLEVVIVGHCGNLLSDTVRQVISFEGPEVTDNDLPYCIPQGIIYPEAIYLVQYADINHSDNGVWASAYEDHTDIIGHVNRGQAETITLAGDMGGANNRNTYTVFFDWNRDGIFDPYTERYEIGETIISFPNTVSEASKEIVVPHDAVLGYIRMRVVKIWDPLVSYAYDPCEIDSEYGQVKDFTIRIGGGYACDNDFVVGEGYDIDVCENESFIVAPTGSSINYNDLEFQWEESVDGENWTDILGAVFPSYEKAEGVIENNKYRLKITCPSADYSSYSSIFNVNVKDPEECYCFPEYNTDCSEDLNFIDDFTLVGENGTSIIDEATGCSENNIDDRTSISPVQLSPGITYTGTIKSGNPDLYDISRTYMSIWIDYNNDGVFNASEKVCSFSDYDAEAAEFNIAIPSYASAGLHRMRVQQTVAHDSDQVCETFEKGEVHDYMVEILSAPLCDGTPSAGYLDDFEVCGGYIFDITLDGTTITESGVTYQWYTSSDGENWEIVYGKTQSSYIDAYLSEDTYFKLEVTCENSQETSESNPIKVSIKPEVECNCNPLGPNYSEPITHVIFAGIDNESSASVLSPTYEDFRFISGVVDAGEEYEISLQGFWEKSENPYYTVYIDWNQDGAFGNGEKYIIGPEVDPEEDELLDPEDWESIYITGTIAVPNDAIQGKTTMRIVKTDAYQSVSGCWIVSEYGQVEDYSLIVNCSAQEQVQIGFTGGQTYCEGSFAQIGVDVTADSYLWSNGSTSQSISVTQGVYTVQVTIDDCVSTSEEIIVIEKPSPTVDLGNENQYYCDDSFVTLDAGSSMNSYLWSTGETTQTIQATEGDYFVTVTKNGCSTTSETINVIESNDLMLSIGDSEQEFCEGESLVLNTGVSGGIYEWSNGETSQALEVTEPGSYSVIVIANGCTSSSNEIEVIELPKPEIDLGEPTQFSCEGAPVALDAGNPGALYLWNTGATSKEINVTEGVYSVKVTNSYGCSHTSDEVEIVWVANPIVDLGDEEQYFCIDEPILLDAGNEGGTYEWSNGAVTQTIEAFEGMYYVTVTKDNCSTTSDFVTVIEVTPPQVGNIIYLEEEDGLLFSVANEDPDATYFWEFGDGETSTEMNPYHEYEEDGVYEVKVTVSNECGETERTEEVNFYRSGLEEFNNVDLELYPNPASEFINIENKNLTSMKSVEVYDVLGQLVSNKNIENTNSHQLDISKLASGIYNIQISMSNGVVVNKKIIRK